MKATTKTAPSTTPDLVHEPATAPAPTSVSPEEVEAEVTQSASQKVAEEVPELEVKETDKEKKEGDVDTVLSSVSHQLEDFDRRLTDLNKDQVYLLSQRRDNYNRIHEVRMNLLLLFPLITI